jgi:hypothetical protein
MLSTSGVQSIYISEAYVDVLPLSIVPLPCVYLLVYCSELTIHIVDLLEMHSTFSKLMQEELLYGKLLGRCNEVSRCRAPGTE